MMPSNNGKLHTFDRFIATAKHGSAFPNTKPFRKASRREDHPMWNQNGFSEADHDADTTQRRPHQCQRQGMFWVPSPMALTPQRA